jgi:hypothetical protein
MRKIPLTWILLGVLVLFLVGFISIQGPGVQCPGSMTFCPGVGCVSGPEKCNAGYTGGPSATFSTTWEKEQFTNGKDMYPRLPKFSVPDAPVLSKCWNGTRARDGRCPEFLGP